MTQRFDIVVVGGGLAGATLALAMRGHPAQIAVIDALPPLSEKAVIDDKRHIALSDSSRRIFETLGLWQALVDVATPIRQIQISEQYVFGTMQIAAAEEGLTALAWVVPYQLLLKTLQSLAALADNVKLIAPAKVVALNLQSEGDSTIYAESDKGSIEIKATSVVLADGGSQLQAMAGFKSQSFAYNQTAIATTITTERAIGDTAYERFTAHGPLALLPIGENDCAVVWMQQTEQVEQIMLSDDATFIAKLQHDIGQRLGTILRAGKREAYPLKRATADCLTKGCHLVLGNAAHTLHPVAAQGFNLTLRDIAELAETLFQSEDLRLADLDAWERNRKKDIQRVTRFTDVLARAYTLPGVSGIRAFALMSLELCPPLRRQVIRGSLGLLPPLSRLASGLPLSLNT